MSEETKLNTQTEEQTEQAEQNPEISQIQNLTRERDEWKDKCLRLAADYENFKKRTAKERIQWQQLITGKVLQEILMLADDIDRARSAQADQIPALDVISKQLNSLLQSYNVTKCAMLLILILCIMKQLPMCRLINMHQGIL